MHCLYARTQEYLKNKGGHLNKNIIKKSLEGDSSSLKLNKCFIKRITPSSSGCILFVPF